MKTIICDECKSEASKFHGFGRDLCWCCYSSFIVSPYRAVDLTISKKCVDASAQIELEFIGGSYDYATYKTT